VDTPAPEQGPTSPRSPQPSSQRLWAGLQLTRVNPAEFLTDVHPRRARGILLGDVPDPGDRREAAGAAVSSQLRLSMLMAYAGVLLGCATVQPPGTPSGGGVPLFSVQLWDGHTGQAVGEPMLHPGVRRASFSADGRLLVTVADDSVRVWDVSRGAPVGGVIRHQGYIGRAVFSLDGSRLVTASHDHTARLWDPLTAAPAGAPMQHDDKVISAVFTPDGLTVATASFDQTVRLWDSHTGAPRRSPLRQQGKAFSTQFTPDGSRMLVGVEGGAELWDIEKGERVRPLIPYPPATGRRPLVTGSLLTADGRHILLSNGEAVEVWDAVTGARRGSVAGLRQIFPPVSSPDGMRIFVSTIDGVGHLWSIAEQTFVGVPIRHGRPVFEARWSPDGRRLLTGAFDGTARIWDGLTGDPLVPPMHHEGTVLGVSFSPDGSRVVTQSSDRTARLWDASTGHLVATPMRHACSVDSTTFSPAGDRIVTVSVACPKRRRPPVAAYPAPDEGGRTAGRARPGRARSRAERAGQRVEKGKLAFRRTGEMALPGIELAAKAPK
jgi:WD40 repeat protein